MCNAGRILLQMLDVKTMTTIMDIVTLVTYLFPLLPFACLYAGLCSRTSSHHPLHDVRSLHGVLVLAYQYQQT